MSDSTATRITAGTAIVAGVVALVGNGLAPRITGDDVDVYRKIAHSTRYAASGVIILVAVLLVTAAFVGFTRVWNRSRFGDLGHYGRLAAVIGGSIAVLQAGVGLFSYKQEAMLFAGANSNNVVSAFWATSAIDRVNSAMFATWTLVLLGLAPVLIGATQFIAGGRLRFLGASAVLGGLVCIVVGIASLLTSDQSTYDIPFAIGSVIVTLWLIATGIELWRSPADGVIDVSDSPAGLLQSKT